MRYRIGSLISHMCIFPYDGTDRIRFAGLGSDSPLSAGCVRLPEDSICFAIRLLLYPLSGECQDTGRKEISLWYASAESAEKRACCKIKQHALESWYCLHPADVGAVIDRPRAINNRPYEFYRGFYAFCDKPFWPAYFAMAAAVWAATLALLYTRRILEARLLPPVI